MFFSKKSGINSELSLTSCRNFHQNSQDKCDCVVDRAELVDDLIELSGGHPVLADHDDTTL